ncbi:hypothetical protein SAMN05192574_101890 [Mucilaginibacter gossypiicola]|uniref:Uncharacterized protein n=1 Tax=Mucilaginibacter gossypiicola TaxID=551995 RepID=A0A1H8BGT4_9SPHI|nr:hypothetical protein [Mucilaginibacter gossypiicola]SEM81344.1 hypothetical protein SAMN05192574_101890 [Mucilaginibacter gossypiicola]
MKRTLLVAFILLIGQIAFVQKKIPTLYENDPNALNIDVKDAYKYIGKVVIVHDSIYSAKIYQDSIAVCQVGKKTNTPRLMFIYLNKSQAPLEQKYVHAFQANKVWIKGIVLGTEESPLIISYGLDYFSLTK